MRERRFPHRCVFIKPAHNTLRQTNHHVWSPNGKKSGKTSLFQRLKMSWVNLQSSCSPLWSLLSFGSVSPLSLCLLLARSGDVDAVEVVGSEGAVALGAFPLPGVVAHLQTLVAEDVETLGEDGLLVPRVAAGAAQLGLSGEFKPSQK